jgi:ubiquinone/menaquinone biosynthesis C-methylase UbiE
MRESFFPNSVREKALATAGVRPGSLAADIGAGSGFVVEELLRRGARVIAVDESDAMIELMQRKFGSNGSVEYRLGESQQLPLATAQVDYVFANMYLHHVERPAFAIQEMARILKPGGTLVITDLDEHTFEFLRTEQHDRWMGFKRDDVRTWFEQAGLQQITIDCTDDNCCARSEKGEGEAKISILLAAGRKPL